MTAALSAYTHVLIGYGVTGAGLSWFTWRVLSKGRRLARQIPDDEKPWL